MDCLSLNFALFQFLCVTVLSMFVYDKYVIPPIDIIPVCLGSFLLRFISEG